MVLMVARVPSKHTVGVRVSLVAQEETQVRVLAEEGSQLYTIEIGDVYAPKTYSVV